MGLGRGMRRTEVAMVWILIAATVITIVAATPGSLDPTQWVVRSWRPRSADRLRTVTATIVLVCGLVLWRWRPANRTGPGLIAMAFTFELFVWATQLGEPHRDLAIAASAGLLRPVLFFVVLAAPSGRTRRLDRWALSIPAAAAVCAVTAEVIFMNAGPSDTLDPDASWIAAGLQQLAETVLLPLGALVVAGMRIARHRPLHGAARRLDQLTLAAALAATIPDLMLTITSDYLVDPNEAEWSMGWYLIVMADSARFVAVALLLLASAGRARRFASSTGTTLEVEVGTDTSAPLRDQLATALQADDVRIGFRSGEHWVTADGERLAKPNGQRCITVIESDGEPVAMVDLDERFNERPTSIELAVAAATQTIEYQRLSALARQRLAAARRARAEVLAVEDSVRVRLQRDLHDGAQQQLVGLALQASLASRTGVAVDAATDTVDGLRHGIESARTDLHRLADGLAPTVIAELGLGAALGTLAATTPLDVEVRIDLPGSIGATSTNVAWFVVCEAVANAVRHAGADSLSIDATRNGSSVEVTVSDDGNGCAVLSNGNGLRLLASRVAGIGGTLTVDSEPGIGTTIHASLPNGVP